MFDRRTNQARDVAVAADEVMTEIRARPAAVGDRRRQGWLGRALSIQRLGGAGLAVVLLHVTRLAVALVGGIEVPVARPIGISTAEPLGVGALDREPADPFANAVLDGQRVGHIVTGAAQFGSRHEHMVVAVVLG